MNEQQIQSKIIKYLESQGAWVCKVITASKSGVPDILACLNGQMVAVEVKKPGKKLTVIQKHNLNKIKLAGGLGIVADSVDNLIDELLYFSLSVTK